MAVPSLPSGWTLRPGVGYLKGLASSTVADADRENGVTEEDLAEACEEAWELMISRFSTMYSVGDWGNTPPIPLKRIWTLLAASIVWRMVANKNNIAPTDANSGNNQIEALEQKALAELETYTDPKREGQRATLMHPYTGSIVKPRLGIAVPYHANPRGYTIFTQSRLDGNSMDELMATKTRALDAEGLS